MQTITENEMDEWTKQFPTIGTSYAYHGDTHETTHHRRSPDHGRSGAEGRQRAGCQRVPGTGSEGFQPAERLSRTLSRQRIQHGVSAEGRDQRLGDRKSKRLNSSHVAL